MRLLLTSYIEADSDLLKFVRESETFDLQLDCGNSGYPDAILKQNSIISVRGEDDSQDIQSYMRLLEIEGAKILLINGSKEATNFGTDFVEQKAYELRADICIYGHVKEQAIFKKSNVLYLSPGLFRQNKEYLMVNINSKNDIQVIKKTVENEWWDKKSRGYFK